MKVKVYNYTPNPLQVMGESAGMCWGSNPSRAVGIAKDCFETNHGRVSEFADISFEISECSARLQRQVYTAMVGISKLQQSTRYVNMVEFEYITPPSIEKKPIAKDVYDKTMSNIQGAMRQLETMGIHKEDYANLLPLGSHTKMVMKINIRALITMSHQRMCTRAYWEFQNLMKAIQVAIREIGDEQWSYIADMLVPKCDYYGYCTEDQTKTDCRRNPTKQEVLNI